MAISIQSIENDVLILEVSIPLGSSMLEGEKQIETPMCQPASIQSLYEIT